MHKDDLKAWNEMVKTLRRSGTVSIQSDKRLRALLAVDELVQAATSAGMDVQGEDNADA
jgi:hypothetical protein